MSKRIWITYAWADRKSGDVDYIVQEIQSTGLETKLDRWNLSAGRRLWEQIQGFISDPRESDAWLIIATANSLTSEKCKEELFYALDRALRKRGDQFPVIALFPGPVDNALIPPAIQSRLYLSMSDPDWKERLVAAVQGRPPSIPKKRIDPYETQIHPKTRQSRQALEIRPRAGVWQPIFVAIPVKEKEAVNPSITSGPPGGTPAMAMIHGPGSGTSDDGGWHVLTIQNAASPSESIYLTCDQLPSKVRFGVLNGNPQFVFCLSDEARLKQLYSEFWKGSLSETKIFELIDLILRDQPGFLQDSDVFMFAGPELGEGRIQVEVWMFDSGDGRKNICVGEVRTAIGRRLAGIPPKGEDEVLLTSLIRWFTRMKMENAKLLIKEL